MIRGNSQLTMNNKLILYKSILKPIWTYGIQLWGTASNSNIEILQRFQNKVLRTIVNAPWYVLNYVLHNDLKILSVKEEMQKFSEKYRDRVTTHPNPLAVGLMDNITDSRHLKRPKPMNLPNRFNI